MINFWELSDLEKKLNEETPNSVKLFSGDSRKQFTYFGLENMAEVVDLRSALNQFRTIVEEGEGSSLFTLTGDINKESHFLKFIQIYTMCDVNISTENMNN